SATVSASVGVTVFPADDGDADTLLRHADQAMYLAKQAGRNRYHVFDMVQDKEVQVQREQHARLAQALRSGELVLFYQPKVDLETGDVVGAEALLRWLHPEQGLLSPGTFLWQLTGTELEISLGEWVVETALTQLMHWKTSLSPLPSDFCISVNLSGQQLLKPGFQVWLQGVLQRFPSVGPGELELEILESAALADMGTAAAVMTDCRAMGVRFALDDFGTGYSSLAYFRTLPVDVIKIDQSFVRDMLQDADDLGIVQSVVYLAHAFHRPVIAEGVETLAHAAALLRLGCHLAQGYGIGRPMPASGWIAWLHDWQMFKAWETLRD
ncbi:MAG: GGDEF domain-containing phosphodiesterase, partial [Burkholderiales bacterium]|nr:GGDEF domain-containing phosphodiesterase [Burkholderiales bacterium]